MIIGLFPELLSPGGVQTAGRQTTAALVLSGGCRGASCRFLSLNDPAGPQSFHLGGTEVVFEGFGRRRGKFVRAALGAAREAKLVWAAHPHLAPVVAVMQLVRPSLISIVCAHGVEVWTPMSALRRFAMRRANAVAAPSRYTCEKLAAEQGIPAGRVHRLPWCLDPSFEALAGSPRRELIPRDLPAGPMILTVGRWSSAERYKGLDELIEVMAAVRAEIPEAHLVALGNGDDRPRLEKKASALAPADAVQFLDSVQGSELVALYNRCQVFAMPSSGEGFGLVFLEAMALGKPVVGGAHGGVPDIIEDGQNGYLVRRDDRQRLASVLVDLLRDENLRREMGQRGRARLAHEFQFGNFSVRLDLILNQCGFSS